MKLQSCLLPIFIVLSVSFLFGQQFEIRDTDKMKWFKGNLHTHAREGESDSSVEEVVNWYKNNGYQFLVITDHDTITYPPGLSDSADSSFLFIPGEEITGYGNQIDLEINGLNIHEAIPRLHDDTVPCALQQCIDAVRRQQGVPMINHPNYKWRLDGKVLLGSRDCNLFEMYNGFPGTNSLGDADHPGLEAVWDFMLTSGKRIYGAAADDGHSYHQFSSDLSNPGRGWVAVKARHLDANEIMRNLDSGLFYSSKGVEIEDLQITTTRIEILIRIEENVGYATDFIGSGGKPLHSTKSNPAVYELSSEKGYVRAKITDTNGHCAWIQPVFIVQ